jgi:hypothetical protein
MTIYSEFANGVGELGKGVADAVTGPMPGVVKAVQVGVDTIDHLAPSSTIHGQFVPVQRTAEPDLAFGSGQAHLQGLAERLVDQLVNHDAFGAGAPHGGTAPAPAPHTEHITQQADKQHDGNYHQDHHHETWSAHHGDEMHHDPAHGFLAEPGHEIAGFFA